MPHVFFWTWVPLFVNSFHCLLVEEGQLELIRLSLFKKIRKGRNVLLVVAS